VDTGAVKNGVVKGRNSTHMKSPKKRVPMMSTFSMQMNHDLTNSNSNINAEFSDQHQFENKRKNKTTLSCIGGIKGKEKISQINYNLN
jgi:hypothetical protein